MKKKLIIFLLCLLVAGCGKHACGSRIRVVTTLFPFYDFARSIGGDRIDVVLLLPPGSEAHTYKPAPGDIDKIKRCDVFIYTGSVMEPWVEDVVASLGSSGIALVDASKVAGDKIISGRPSDLIREQQDYAGKDPHFWLDFNIDLLIVDSILSSFCKKDPEGADYYTSNALVYKTRLIQLDNMYRETLRKCGINTILYTGHFSLGYICTRYGLRFYSPYNDFLPYPEPSSRNVAELNLRAGTTGVSYIFYEELSDARIAKNIAEETGVKILLLHGGHNISREELDSGTDFIRIMDGNLERLKLGLGYR